MTGRRCGADEAARLGLVQEVVPADDLLDAVRALAAEIAANAPLAVQSIKRTINEFARQGFNEAGRFEALSSSLSFISDDLYEGFAAGAAKRRAEFQGL